MAGLEGTVGRHDNHLGVLAARLRAREDVEPEAVGHHEVGEDEIERRRGAERSLAPAENEGATDTS